MSILDEGILRRVIRVREARSHKGDYGRVLVIGRNARYGGAAILAASAAVYLHSRIAAELAENAYVVLPSRVIEAIPGVMKRYARKIEPFC